MERLQTDKVFDIIDDFVTDIPAWCRISIQSHNAIFKNRFYTLYS